MGLKYNGTSYSIQVAPIELEFTSSYYSYGFNITDFLTQANATVSNTAALKTAVATAKLGLASSLASSSSLSSLTSGFAGSSGSVTSAINAAAASSTAGNSTKMYSITDLSNGYGSFLAMTNPQNSQNGKCAAAYKIAQMNKSNAGGFNDWYLPSYYELNAIFFQAKPTDSSTTDDTMVLRNPIDDTSYTSPEIVDANGKPIPYKRNAGQVNGREPPGAIQTTKRSFKIQDGIIGVNSFKPTDGVHYMTSTLHFSKNTCYTISFDDGHIVQHTIFDTCYVRPVRKVTK